jgi:hypothetical protein
MRYSHINELMLDPIFPLRECVENRDKIVIENVSKNTNNSKELTYTEIVSIEDTTMKKNDEIILFN